MDGVTGSNLAQQKVTDVSSDKHRSEHSDFENMLFGRVVQKSQTDEIIDKEILDLELGDDEEMSGSPNEPGSSAMPADNARKGSQQLDQEA